MKKIFITLLIFIAVGFNFSCAKKPSGVSAKKTQGASLNPHSTSAAVSVATQYGVDYLISMIDYPKCNAGVCTVNVDLQTPTKQYLNLATTHQNMQDSYGSYNDPQGNEVRIQARCVGLQCDAYYLMVTVYQNHQFNGPQALLQSIGISYRNDCNFRTASYSPSTYGLFQTLDQVVTGYQWNYQPQNNCPQQ